MEKANSENLPTCRVCGKPMQLLDEENQQWYCYKDDQVWLGKEQKWKEPRVEQPQTEQTQAVKYCKKCGNKLEFGDEFCDKCGAEQKKSVAIAVTGTATEETTSKDRHQKTNPRLLIAAAFIVVILIAAVIWYISIPQPAFFDIRVQSNTSWQGSYGTPGSMTTVDGSGEEDFSAQGTIVSAVFQMQTGNYGDTLTVTIFRGNTVLATQTTTAPYGVVSVSATSTEQGQSQVIQTMQESQITESSYSTQAQITQVSQQTNQQTNQLRFTGFVVTGKCWSYGLGYSSANIHASDMPVVYNNSTSTGGCPYPNGVEPNPDAIAPILESGTVIINATNYCEYEFGVSYGECQISVTTGGTVVWGNEVNTWQVFVSQVSVTAYCNGNIYTPPPENVYVAQSIKSVSMSCS